MSGNKVQLDLDASDKATPKLAAAIDAQNKLEKSTRKVAAASAEQAKAETAAGAAIGESTKLTLKLTTAHRGLVEEVRKEKAARSQASEWARLGNQAENKAFQDSLRRRREQAKMREELALSGKEAGRFGAAMSGAFSKVGGAVAAVSAGIGVVSREIDLLMEKAERQKKTAAGMRDFVAALPDGPEGERLLNLVGETGVRYGVKADDMAGLAEPLLANSDSDGDGSLNKDEKKKFTQGIVGGGILMGAGVASADAGNIILAGDNKGVDGGAAASKLMKAAEISMRNPDVFSKAASAVGQFDSFDTGLAVTTALSKGELNVGLIPQRVQDANLALNSASDTGEFAQAHGLAGLSQAEKIRKLRAAAEASGNVQAFTDNFKNQGLDESKALSVGMLVQRGELFDRTMTGLEDTKGFAFDKLTRMREHDLTRAGMAQQVSTAAMAWNELRGPDADKARGAFERQLAHGNELQRFGALRAVDPETGLPKQAALSMEGGANVYDRLTGVAQAGVNGMEIFGRPGAAGGGAAPAPADALAGWQSQMISALQENNRLLAENNAATRENTGKANKSRPAAPVEGEKY